MISRSLSRHAPQRLAAELVGWPNGHAARPARGHSAADCAAGSPSLRTKARPRAKAAGVFDKTTRSRPTPQTKAGRSAAKPNASHADRDSIGFTQENVAAQMTELEERMFRLSEALRGLEPENASRLRLALKFSREELILDQMKETQKLLKEAQLSKAETEVRELLAKLEHLRNLLLAEDLDFQMKLARLRQMRETLSQLERIIKEEKRELALVAFGDGEAEGDRGAARPTRPTSRRSSATEGLSSTTREKPPKKEGDDAKKGARAASRERETGVRKSGRGARCRPRVRRPRAALSRNRPTLTWVTP